MARSARIRYAPATASPTASTPAASASAATSTDRSRRPTAPPEPTAAGGVEGSRQRREVRGEPLPRGLLRGDAAGEFRADVVQPFAGPRGHGDHRYGTQTLDAQQAAQVGQAPLAGRGREAVDLVEHDDRHGGVPGQGDEVAVVQGGVGVLLRVEHPDEQVDALHQPVRLEPVRDLHGVDVRQVEEHQPLERRRGR